MISRVLIVDDEPLARDRLVGLVRALTPGAAVREAPDGSAAVDLIRDWAPDAVILDIQMPGRSGFEVIEAIGADRMPLTIFATAHDNEAVRAFEVAAVDYLLKPFEDERFAAAWRRLEALRHSGEVMVQARRLTSLLAATPSAPSAPDDPAPAPRRYLERLAVKLDQRTIMVPLSDVYLLEASGNYVTLHTAKGNHLVRETLTALESRLDPARFVRIHRRFLVDLTATRELQPWFGGDQMLVLRNGETVKVSRRFRDSFVRRLAGDG